MPEISKNSIKSNYDYSGPTIPDYNLGQGFSQLGAADTQLGRLIGNNYYDEGFYPYSSQQDQRYANQGRLNAIGNSLAAIGSKTFLVGIPSILGSATSLLASPLALAKGTSLADVFENNPLNQVAKYVDETTNELTPRFQRSDFNGLSFAQQLARPGELLTENVDSIAFMAQSFVPAAILAKASFGAKMADRLVKSRALYQPLTKLAGANTQAVANAIDFTTSLGLLSTNEAALEGVDAKKQIKEKLSAERNSGKNTYSDDQIEEIANKGFQNVFWNNMIYSTITNGVFQKLLMPIFRLPVNTRANEMGLRLVGGKLEAPSYNGLNSFLFDKTNVAGAVTKAVGADVLAEGLEESIQYSIQNAGAINSKYTDFSSSFGKVLQDIVSGEVLNLTDKERGKAFGLGALMGGGSSAIRSFLPVTAEETDDNGNVIGTKTTLNAAAEAKRLRDTRTKRISSYNQAYTDLIDHSFALRQPDEKIELSKEDGETPKFYKSVNGAKAEITQQAYEQEIKANNLDSNGGEYTKRGEYQFTDDGKIVANQELLNRVTSDAMEAAEISDYMDLERIKGNPDKVRQRLYRNMLLSNLANQAFRSQTADLLIENLEQLANANDTTLADYGINKEDAAQEVNNMVEYVKQLEAIYNTGLNTIIPTGTSDKILKDTELRRRAFYRKASKAASLDSLIRDVKAQADTLAEQLSERYGEDLQKHEVNGKVTERAKEILDIAYDRDLTAKEVEELNGLAEQVDFNLLTEVAKDNDLANYVSSTTKLAALSEARKSIGKEIDRILSSKKWKEKPTEQITTHESPRTLKVNEGLSADTYRLYNEVNVRKMRLKDNFDAIRAEVHSDLLEQLILSNKPLDGRMEDAIKFMDHLKFSNVFLSSEARDLLRTYVNDLLTDSAKSIEELTQEFNTLMDGIVTPQEFDYSMSGYASDPTRAVEVFDQLKNLEKLQNELRKTFSEGATASLDNQNNQDARIERTDFIRTVDTANEFLKPSDIIIEVANFDGNKINEDYLDLASVEYEINKLTILAPLVGEVVSNDMKRKFEERIALLKKIKDLVVENLSNKEAADIRETILYSQGYINLYDNGLNKLIKLDPDKEEILNRLRTEDPYVAGLIINDLGAQIKDADLTEIRAKLIQRITERFNKLSSGSFNKLTSILGATLEAFVDSPVKVFTAILADLSRRLGDSDLDRFSKDLNITKYLSSSSLNAEERQNLVDIYTEAFALRQIRNSSTSSSGGFLLNNIQAYLKEQQDRKDKELSHGFPPSSAQERVIKELLAATQVKSTRPAQLFDNVIAIKALPGAGKSSVIVPVASKLLKLKNEEILTAANKQEAALNIASLTGTSHPSNSILELTDKLKNGAIPKETKVMIVDEIGGASMNEVYDLMAAFAQYQRKNMDHHLKMWVIYDPNQTNTSQFGRPRIEYDSYTPISDQTYLAAASNPNTSENRKLIEAYHTGEKRVGGYLPLVHNMQVVSPMITSYRSNVAGIVDTMNYFLSSNAVDSLTLPTAVSTTLDNPVNIQGVYADKLKNEAKVNRIIQAYTNSAVVNSERSRIIVVGNEAKKAAYKKALPNAKVLTAMESAGMSVSEVYVDIETADSPDYVNSTLVYNQAMFTAISRARDFVLMTNQNGKNDIDPTINDKARTTAKAGEANYEVALTRKEKQIERYSSFFGKEKVAENKPTEEKKAAEEQQVERVEETEEQKMDNGAMDLILPVLPESDLPNPPQEKYLKGAHFLKYVTSENLDKLNGNEVEIFHDVSNNMSRYVIGQKQGGNSILPIAILSDIEKADFERSTGITLNAISGVPLEKDPRIDGNFRVSSAFTGGVDSVKVYIQPGASKLKYVYGDKETEDFSQSPLVLFKKWANDFFADGPIEISNYNEVLSNPGDFLKIVIHTEREAAAINPNHVPYNPYLVISGLRRNGKVLKTQYIKLAPARLRQTTEVQQILTMMQNMERLKLMMQEFYGQGHILAQLGPGIPLEVDANNIYYPYAAMIRGLATGEYQFASDDYNTFVKQRKPEFELPPLDFKGKIPEEIVQLAQEIYLANHSALDKQDYKGPAQLAFNRIAAVNFSATTNSGRTILLRDYPGYAIRDGVNYAVGQSLIGRVKFEHNEGKSFNPVASPKFKEALASVALSERAQWRKGSLMALHEALQKGNNVHINPLTQEDLEEVFIKGYSSNRGDYYYLNNGYGLRTPLNFKVFSKEMRIDDPELRLVGEVVSFFEKVQRPRVAVATNPDVLQQPVEVDKRSTYQKFYERLVELKQEDLTDAAIIETLTSEFPGIRNIVDRVQNYNNELYYRTRQTAITKKLKEVLNDEDDDLTQVIKVISDSGEVTDKGKVGSRDYVRAFILQRVLGGELLTNLDFARKYWISDKVKNEVEASFDEQLREDFAKHFSSHPQAEVNLAYVESIFNRAFKQLDIPFTLSTGSALERINAIVDATSVYRQRERTTTITKNDLAIIEELRNILDDFGKDSKEAKAYFNKHKEVLQKHGLNQKLNEDALSERIDEITVERSLTFDSNPDIKFDISEIDGQTLFRIFSPPTFKDVIARIFRRRKGEVFHMVDSAFMEHKLGKHNWGLFKNGVVYVLAKDGKTSSKVIKHEAFHKAFWNYLSSTDRIKALDLARTKYGDKTEVELEEDLANDFMNYVQKPKSIGGQLALIFKKILRYFGFVFNNFKSLDELFENLSSGLLAERFDSKVERDLAQRWPTIAQYQLAKNAFFEVFENLFYNSRQDANAPIYSFDEAVDATITTLNRMIEDPSVNPELAEALSVFNVDKQAATAEFISKFFYSTNVKSLRKGRISALKNRRKILREDLELLNSNDDQEIDGENQIQQLEDELAKIEADIEEETIQSDLVNPMDKVSGRVKQKLISVQYMKNGRVIKGDYYSVFNALLPMLSQADTSSFEAFEKSIYTHLAKFRNAFTEEIPSNVRKAAAKFMDATLSGIARSNQASPKNLTFFKDATSTMEYVVYSLDGSSTRNITRELAIKNPSRYLVIDRLGVLGQSNYQNLNDFVKMVSSITNVEPLGIKASYFLFEDLSFIKSLIASTASLVRGNPFVANSKYENYRYTASYSANRLSGAKAVLEASIVDALVQHIYTNKENMLPTSIRMTLRNGTSIDKVKKTLEMLKLPSVKLEAYSQPYLDTVAASISIALPKLLTSYEQLKDKTSFSDIYELVNDEGSLISALSDILTTDSAATELNNFVRGDGKRAYIHRDASYQSAVIHFLTKKVKHVGRMFRSIAYNSDNKLVANTILGQENLFVNGGNIYSFIDHDSIKQKGKEKYAKYLHSEGPIENIERTFKYGFLDRLRTSKGKSYFQFLPIPSNRRTITALEIDILDRNTATAQIRKILEAQMNRPAPSKENGLDNVVNYAKRYKKWTFPGLTGSISGNLDEAVKQVLAHVEKESQVLSDKLSLGINGRVIKFDERSVDAYVARFMPNENTGMLSRVAFDEKMKDLRTKRRAKGISDEIKARIDDQIQNLQLTQKIGLDNVLTHAAKTFYLNHIVNQYSLSQLIYGDEVFYKSKEDQTKRIQGATGTGDVYLTDPVVGLPNISKEEFAAGNTELAFANRVVVMDDVKGMVPSDMEFTRLDSYRDSFDETDAQGYILPELYEQYAKAAGVEANTDLSLKPLYFNVTKEGVPVLIKFSIATISDEFTEGVKVLSDDALLDRNGQPVQFLVDLRNKMRKANAGMLVFSSGVKLGRPVRTAKILDNGFAGSHNGDDFFSEDNILTIDNTNLRFQLNPAKEVDVDVANPSQLTAFANTNGQSEEETKALYQHNASLIRLGQIGSDVELGITSTGLITPSTLDHVRYTVSESIASTPGTEVVHNMLSATDANGEYVASMNNPIVQDKFVASLSSMVTRDTVGFRLDGSKLILQAEFGLTNAKQAGLKWRDEEGYTEVLLPESYRRFFSEGDKIAGSSKKNIVGFRIPSSNLHSGIAMKVKGFYKVPEGAEGNVIIAPSLIVYVHGSDYDVDTLFAIRKELTKQSVDLNDIISKYYPTHRYTETLYTKEGEAFGAGNETVSKVNGEYIHEYLEKILRSIQIEIDDDKRRLQDLKGSERRQLLADIKSKRSDFNVVLNFAKLSAKNSIIHTFADILLSEKNRIDINTPISLTRVTKAKGDVRNELASLMRKEDFLRDLELAKMISRKPSLQDAQGNPITIDELVELANSGDLSRITPSEMNGLAKKIFAKFDWKNLPESVMEMLANRNPARKEIKDEFLTTDQIEELLYPAGQLTDYNVQSAIHTNTYSGLRLTGIAANSAKTIAYVFSMADGLPMLRKPFHLRVDKGVYDSFSRTERQKVGSELVDIVVNERPINIFETLDTILNLAIDNVKEQKLSFLGITNNNANLFLTALAYGLPLNTVVRMFSSPVMKMLDLKGRVTQDSLASASFSLAKDLTEEDIKKGIEDLGEDYTSLYNYASKLATRNDETIVSALVKTIKSRLFVSSEALDAQASGRLSAQARVIHNIVLLEQMKSLASVGEELFKYSQILTLLRGLPNTKWKMDYLAESYASLVESEELKNVKESTKAILLTDHINEYKQTSYEYSAATDDVKENLVAAEKERYLNSDTFKRELAMTKDKVIRSAIYDTAADNFEQSKNSVFSNALITNIPHLYEAYRSLQKLRRLLESTLGLHAPVLKQFAKDVFSEGNISGAFINNEQIELIQKEFIRMLSSDLRFTIDNDLIDLTAPANTYYTVPSTGVLLEGHDAYSQLLAVKLRKAKIDYPNNFFLQNVEINLDSRGTYTIGITADKSGEEEVSLEIKSSFDSLVSNPETRWIALDLFKNEITTRGLLFGRTAFSLVFPAHFVGAFTSALDARLENILGVGEELAKSRLNNVKYIFMLQYLKNNPDTVKFLPRYKGAYPKPVVTGYYASSGGSNVQYLSGVDSVNGKEVYYDLKYELLGRSPEAFLNIIKTYGEETYIKHSYSDTHVYYRLLTKKGLSKHFTFKDNYFESRFDLQTYTRPELNVLRNYTLLGNNSFVIPIGVATLKTGDTVYLVDNYSAVPLNLRKVTVKTAEVRGTKSIYSFSLEEVIPIIKENTISTSKSRYVITTNALKMSQINQGVAIDENTIDISVINSAVDQINSLPLSDNYFIDPSLLSSVNSVDPQGAKQLAEAIYSKTGYKSSLLTNEIAPADKLYLHYRNTVRDITSKLHSLDDLTVYTNVEYTELDEGDVVWLGTNEEGISVYGRTISVKDGRTTFEKFNEYVFNKISSSNITQDELNDLKQQTHC